MKLKCIGISIGIVLMLAAACSGSTGGSSDAPLAVAPEPIFQFEPVLDGEEVVHDFVVENRGTAELVIHKVQTG
jgi:ABC-type glycerol-3-phosphate transport system substrate-binding protein